METERHDHTLQKWETERDDHTAEMETERHDHTAEMETERHDHTAEMETERHDHTAEMETERDDHTAEMAVSGLQDDHTQQKWRSADCKMTTHDAEVWCWVTRLSALSAARLFIFLCL